MTGPNSRLRVVYMGTPEFACPTLVMLAGRNDVAVRLVVTQPDRPAGRGRRMTSPPVKVEAERLGLPIYGIDSLRTATSREPIVAADPELIVVAAFGIILGRSILELPVLGCVNLHASLLPALRGANPVATAIHERYPTTGISLMRMARGLDTGPVYAATQRDIKPGDTAESLTASLGKDAASLLDSSLDHLRAGRLTAVPQDDSNATCTRPISKDDGWIDWSRSASEVDAHVRAMWPWPRAWTTLPDSIRLQVHRVEPDAQVLDAADAAIPCGTTRRRGDTVRVRTADGWVRLTVIQVAGKAATKGSEIARHPMWATVSSLGTVDRPPVQPPSISRCLEQCD